MDIPVKISTEKLIDFSGEHLYYEIKMLYEVSRMLLEGPDNIYIYNALLESFVIHASVVLDFFYKPQKKTDDAKAEHFMKYPKAWKALLPPYSKHFKNFDKKRNKEVVHLSYRRLEVKPEEKKWGSPKITKEIKKIVNLFLANANPELVHPKLYELRS